MNDDDLLRRLGQVAREQAAGGGLLLDERWDRLAAGTLSAEEDAELRRLAASSGEAREAYEAFRPLPAQFHARVVEAVATPAKVLRFRRTVKRLAAWGVATGAAAATLAALLLRLPALPLYAVAEISGGSRTTRGELSEATLAPGDRFEVALRPETAVRRAGSLRTRAFLIRGSDLRPLDVQTQRDESGAVRLAGTLDRDLPPGRWTLWLVVGRLGSLPDPERLRSRGAAAPVRERNWVAVPAPLTIGSGAKE